VKKHDSGRKHKGGAKHGNAKAAHRAHVVGAHAKHVKAEPPKKGG